MKKRILISILVIAAILASYLIIPQLFRGEEQAYAYGFRDGYAITPTLADRTGVAVDSAFLLEAEDKETELSIDNVKDAVSILPEVNFHLEKGDKGILIVPDGPLAFNSIYTLYYKGISFAFQTESGFALLGTLPRNETTNVPITTGIEFYMSHEGADVEDVFSIEPAVRGSFEEHGNVAVFVPKGGLEERTVYTVTLAPGMKLAGSDKTIDEGYSFSFETGTKDDTAFPEPKGYFSFNRLLNDFDLDETIQLPVNYSFYRNDTDRTVVMNVYRYASADEMAAALENYNDMPVWSMYGSMDFYADTKGLDRIDTYKIEVDDSYSYPQLLSTGKALPAGFYLMDCTWEDLRFQTFVQVTDLSYAYMEDSSKAYFWTHDLSGGNPAAGTMVSSTDGVAATADEQGVAVLDKKEADSEALAAVYKLKHGDSETLALITRWQIYRYGYYGSNTDYWRYLQTDRGLYQPDDRVSFFGFLKSRYNDDPVGKVTVELSQGSWFYYEFMPFDFPDSALKTMTADVENGFYEGFMDLPALEAGYYNLNVKIGDRIVSSQGFTVEKYVKPDYKMTVTKDKEAIFAGDPVVFTAAASFFEGTPVAGLDVQYNFNGTDFKEGRGTTDIGGALTAGFIPAYRSGNQGIMYGWFTAYASLPESGQISGSDYVRIFMNDIDVQVDASADNGKGTIDVEVHGITLNRLNDGTAKDENDYLADAASGLSMTGKVMRNEWVRSEAGEYYDFINKEVRKQYTYNLETTVFDSFRLTTDGEGKASYTLSLPEEENVYYTAVLNMKDFSGRSVKVERYFGRDYGYYPGEGGYYELTSDKEAYKVGESMTFSWSKGEEGVSGKSYLFAAAQNGIRDIDITEVPSWTRKFSADDVPNIEVQAIAFNGKTYQISGSVSARFDTQERRMEIELKTDKETYRPGDTITVDIKGDKGEARVNLSLVDEALFALQDQQVDTLSSLYEWVSGDILQTGSSHNNQGSNMYYGGFGMRDEMSTIESTATMDTGAAPMMEAADGKGMAEVDVRSDFKDTALFAVVELDSQGRGSYTFTLPDNITSWRLTAAGISYGLDAGTGLAQIPVSMPFFINTTMNTTYLTGDEPQLGVTAYGQQLEPGEAITYLVECEEAGFSSTVESKAFERVLVPLWKMEKGPADITIKAISESGLSDGLVEKILVVDTYHETMQTKLYDLKPGLTVAKGSDGMATLTFLDQGRAKYLPALYNLAFSDGRRLDQRITAQLARNLLADDFKQPMENEKLDIADFMTPDGGLSILPYGNSNLDMTALFVELLKYEVPTEKLKAYLTNAYYIGSEKSPALYGLTMLGEPLLREMNLQLQVENRSLTDTIYLALAYEAIGDTYMANKLFEDHVAPLIDAYDMTARIGTDNSEVTIQQTSLAMLLAARLGLEEADGLYKYSMGHTSKEKLTSLERLLAINAFMSRAETKTLKVVYEYDGQEATVDAAGGVFTRTVPAAMLDTFKVLKVEGIGTLALSGEVAMSALYENDANISATRVYRSYHDDKITTSFVSGDIVKVVIDVDIAEGAIDSYYKIVDYAPSGVVPLTGYNSWGIDNEHGWFREVEGQKVTFYQGSDWKNQVPLYYYARIISPGTFKGDGILVQGTQFHDSLWIGKPSEIEIR